MDGGTWEAIATVVASVITVGISTPATVWVSLRAARLTTEEAHRNEVKRLADSTRAAILSELQIYDELIRLNNYERDLRAIVSELRAGRPRILMLSTSRPSGRVYQALLPNIGYIGTAAPDVIKVYALIESILEEKDQACDLYLPSVRKALEPGMSASPALIAELLRIHEIILAKFEMMQKALAKALADLSVLSS